MKIRKLLFLMLSLITIAMSIYFVGCSDEQLTNNAFGERFGIVERLNDKTIIIYDKETKVQYLYYKRSDDSAITVMFDENGKSLLYEGD